MNIPDNFTVFKAYIAVCSRHSRAAAFMEKNYTGCKYNEVLLYLKHDRVLWRAWKNAVKLLDGTRYGNKEVLPITIQMLSGFKYFYHLENGISREKARRILDMKEKMYKGIY